MIDAVTLSMTGKQHARLRRHLFPGDGKEAVAILLCGRRDGEYRHRLVVREVEGVPYAACTIRTPDRVTWAPDAIAPHLDRAAVERLSIVKVHSHPGGYADFSDTDDEGDRRLLPMIRGWIEEDVPHGSVIMLPNGQMFGRVFNDGASFTKIDLISVVGDDLSFWYADSGGGAIPDFAASQAQVFDVGTIERLRRLWIAVVGCSGTGSPVIEQLLRLGVGVLVLVDDDHIEERNINRILNSTMKDAREHRLKVDMLGEAAERIGLGTRVIRVPKSLWSPEAVRMVAQCDAVFGCVDTVDGRYLLNTLSTYYTLPYFDVGVRLDAVREGPRKGHIREVCGTVHYLQPGGSSLMSRGLFTMEQVRAAGLRRKDPAAHAEQVKDGYIRGVVGHRPAVITVNMFAASLAVNEFLARLHPFREEPNINYEQMTFSLASAELFPESGGAECPLLAKRVGFGDVSPLLRQMELSEQAGR
jgi:hypothetical protein